jgi:hypothetical protein
VRGVAVVELITAVFGLVTGCATSAPAIPATERPAAAVTEPVAAPAAVRQGSGLFFSVTPTDAEIFIDGKARAKVADLEASGGVLSIKPGIYQVSLKRHGFVTWRAEVTVGDGAEAIQVTMVESQ